MVVEVEGGSYPGEDDLAQHNVQVEGVRVGGQEGEVAQAGEAQQ